MAFYMVHFMVLGLGTSLCAPEESGKSTMQAERCFVISFYALSQQF